MVDVTPQSEPLVLRYARDVKSHHRLHPLVAANARLSGLITNIRSYGRIRFLRLRDTTESIQLIARRDLLSSKDWDGVRSVRKTDVVTVTGRVAASESGELSVMLTEVPVRRGKDLETSISEGELDYARVGAQLLAARLRERAAQFFRSAGYLEIEPRLLSLSWGAHGLEPLEARYPGFGGAAYLAPSPAPQLLDALVTTGVERVFALSRCFSTTYRDEKSSAESLILIAKSIAQTATEQRGTLQRSITEILGGFETLPEDFELLLKDWTQQPENWPPQDQTQPLKTPTLEIFDQPSPIGDTDKTRSVSEICRAIWPPNRVIGEAAHERLDESFEVGTCTLHLERMVSLLRDVPIRQLRNVGQTSGTISPASEGGESTPQER